MTEKSPRSYHQQPAELSSKPETGNRPRRIMWLSKNPTTEKQLAALREKFGADTKVDYDPQAFGNAKDIAKRFRDGGYDEMVVVAPLSVVSVLAQEKIPLLWSHARAENDPDKIEFRGAKGQGFAFSHFERIKKVGLEFNDEPEQKETPVKTHKVLWMSRHGYTQKQLEALKTKFGQDTSVTYDPEIFTDAKEIAKRFRAGGFSEIVIVAPLSVIGELAGQHIPVYQAEMVAESDPKKMDYQDTHGGGQRFNRFRRVEKFALEFESQDKEKN